MARKPRILTVWPLTEQVCRPLVYWRRLDSRELLEESEFSKGEESSEQHGFLLRAPQTLSLMSAFPVTTCVTLGKFLNLPVPPFLYV